MMANINRIRLKNRHSLAEWKFKCDFCPIKFRTEDTFNAHILEHFEKKNCLNCNKLILRIGSQWYELHIDVRDECKTEETTLDLNELGTELINESCDMRTNSYDSDECSDNMDDGETGSVFCEELSPISTVSEDDLKELKTEVDLKSTIKTKSTKKAKGISSKGRITETHLKPTRTDQSERNKETMGGGSDPNADGSELHNHMRTANEPKEIETSTEPKQRIECQTCGKTFSNRTNWRTHQTIHNDITRFVCNYCGKGFRRKGYLSEHLNAHIGSKPYQCKICNKCFERHSHLHAHQRVHTGERPFKCDIGDCDRTYAHGVDLKRHKFSAHGIYTKKHPCTICSKVFSENKLLKKHLESHSTGNI